jgi:hypothetical protein
MEVEFTKKGFECFCNALNHRMTRVEINTKWTKLIIGYMAVILSGMFIKSLF